MNGMGYTQFQGINCVYYEEQDCIRLIPATPEEKIIKFMNEHDFVFTYQSGIYKYNAYITKVQICSDYSIKLIPKYIFARNSDLLIHGFQMFGGAIDDFFNPSYYFFPKQQKGEEIGDLLYHKKHVDNWKIKLENVNLNISLSYGNVLANGVGSDMIVHPRLTINFDRDTNDLQFIYKVYLTVIRFFQIVRYDLNFGCCQTELIDSKGYSGGKFYHFDDYRHQHSTHSFYQNYSYYKPYIGTLLQFSANNINMPINHFPKSSFRFDKDSYSPELLVAIFGMFENEYNLLKNVYGIADTSRIQPIKDKLLNDVYEMSEQANTNEEKSFIDVVQTKIKEIGVEFGQTQKIRKVYSTLHNALKSSMENIFYLFDDETKNKLIEGNVAKISNELSTLRSKAAHGTYEMYNDKQAQMIRFLEVLSYAQMLKRATLCDKDIEIIIGLVFQCNFEYQKILS